MWGTPLVYMLCVTRVAPMRGMCGLPNCEQLSQNTKGCPLNLELDKETDAHKDMELEKDQ